jgi:hypothetical protein
LIVADADSPPQTAVRRRSTLHEGEIISALSALALLVLMFAFAWFGLAVTARPSTDNAAMSSAEDAWNGLTIVRWLMLLTIIVTLGSVALHARQRHHGARTDTSRWIAGLGTLTAVLLVYRVLIDLPSPRDITDQKLGAYLGVLAAIGIAFGGFVSIGEERARARARAHRARARQRRIHDA